MPTLIRGSKISSDDWQIVEGEPAASSGSNLIVPAAYAIAQRSAVLEGRLKIGVWLDGDAEVENVADLLPRLPIIAIKFPTFNDGRGLSLAVLLRTRHAFTAELRAIGDVHTDMFHYLMRCGFDSYVLPDGRDPRTALATLNALSDFYQGSVVEPRPAFRRVARGPTTA